jgi:AAA+ ATPase superfamily predicted ATPase
MAADDWRRALLTIGERWQGPGKLVLALDEFQGMASASPELPSILQECWDRHWRESGRILLILCGSLVGFMEREVLGRKSPLFGRRTAQMHLRPFGHIEAAGFHPGWSREDQARAYFLCGGIPQYLLCFDDRRSVEQNIVRQMLDEFAPLFREPDFLLREELREVETYHGVLLAIASGVHVAAKIARTAGVAERGLHYYLRQLIQLGYVARRHPLDGRRPAPRRVRYVLEDPLLRFWFRFVFPNLSYVQSAGPERAFRERMVPQLPAYYGQCFERLCREALPALYDQEGVGVPFEVGEYWDAAVQIDVVGLREDSWTDLGECRWGTVRSAPALARELDAKVAAFPNPRGASTGRRYFVRKAPRTKTADGSWHDLEALYRRR